MGIENPMQYFTEQQLRDMDDMQQRWIDKIAEQKAELATLRTRAEAAENAAAGWEALAKEAHPAMRWRPIDQVPVCNEHPYAATSSADRFVGLFNGFHIGIGYARYNEELEKIEYVAEDGEFITPEPTHFFELRAPQEPRLAIPAEALTRQIETAVVHVIARAEAAESALAELQQAGQAVVDRWDSPAWKDQPHTAEVINRLRDVIAEEGKGSVQS